MRIAMVSEHASPLAAIGGRDAGGQNVHVAELARRLVERGHDVTVHTRRDDPSLPRHVVADGMVVDHVRAGPPQPVDKDDLPRWMGVFARELVARWIDDPPDVVHSHFWMSGRAALDARPVGVPVVHTFHALGVVKRRHLGSADHSPVGRLIVERRVARGVDRIVATCRDEVHELAGMGVDPGRTTIVPCGVDLERFTPPAPDAADPRVNRRARIVVVGRLVARKGTDDVLRALAALPDVELVVAGGPPRQHLGADHEARRLYALADTLRVRDRMTLRGAVARDAMPALLRSADLVVCVPWYEPFGIVPLEAMACGVPVVTSAVGGMLDTVVDGGTGVHVRPRDPRALADAIGALLRDRARRAAMGAAGRRRVERRYGWDTVADATADVYRSLRCRSAVGFGTTLRVVGR